MEQRQGQLHKTLRQNIHHAGEVGELQPVLYNERLGVDEIAMFVTESRRDGLAVLEAITNWCATLEDRLAIETVR